MREIANLCKVGLHKNEKWRICARVVCTKTEKWQICAQVVCTKMRKVANRLKEVKTMNELDKNNV